MNIVIDNRKDLFPLFLVYLLLGIYLIKYPGLTPLHNMLYLLLEGSD